MTSYSATVAISLLAGLAALGVASPAAAGSPGWQGLVIEAQAASEGHVKRRDEDRDVQTCSRAIAENKARRMGVRDPHTYFMSPNVVRVRGVRKGEQVRLAFANAAYCPYLGG